MRICGEPGNGLKFSFKEVAGGYAFTYAAEYKHPCWYASGNFTVDDVVYGATYIPATSTIVGPKGDQGAAIIQVTDKILNVGGWSLVGELYEQSISDASITATSVVDVVPNNADYATVSTAVFLPRTDSSTEAVKVYCRNLPTSNITVTINILN
jgi:hypothetical protein